MFFFFFSGMYYMTMMLFLILTVWTSSWLELWILMELINMMFIPLMMMNNMKHKTSLLLFKTYSVFTMISYMMLFVMSYYNHFYFSMMMMVLLMAKMNLSPFYYWLMPVAKELDFKSFTMFTTTNKLPIFVGIMMLMDYTLSESVKLVVLTSLVMPTLHMLNEVMLTSVLFLSSSYHSTWMMIMLSNKMFKEWFAYFIMYATLMTLIMLNIDKLGINNISNLMTVKSSKNVLNLNMLLLTLMGMPPTCGFLIKMIVLMQMFNSQEMQIMLMFMVLTLSFWIYIYFKMSLKYWLMNNNMTYMKSYLTVNMSTLTLNLMMMSFVFIIFL